MLKRLFHVRISYKKLRLQSIGTKLLFIFVGLVMLLGGALGFVSYRIAATALITQAEAGSEQMINLAGEKLDMKQQLFVDLSKQLSNNSRFIDHLLQITIAELKQDERARRMAEMRTMLGQLALSDSTIHDITLIPLEDPIDSISSNHDIVSVDTTVDWIELVRSNSGTPVWLPVAEQGYIGTTNKPVVAYGKLLGKNNIGSHDFILLVQLEASFIEEMIADIKLGSSGATAVVDASGAIMSSNGGAYYENELEVDHGAEEADLELFIDHEQFYESAAIGSEGNSVSGSLRSGKQLVVYRTSALSDWTIIGTVPLAELTSAANDIKGVTLWVLGVSIIFAIGSGMLLVMSIRRPLKELESMMSMAAAGDFRNRMKQRSRDEIGRVAQAYNVMVEQLAGLMVELRRIVLKLTQSTEKITLAAEHTDRAANEIRTASEQIARGAVELASNAEQGSLRVADMNDIIKEVASLQQQMSQAAALACESGFQGETAAKQLLAATNESEASMVAVNDRIMQLTEVTSSIGKLLQLMQQLSKKTKVLSLNATIEAVRAGSAGASFKVIADEIRMLAEQTNDSIEKAGEMTTYIVQEVHATVMAVQVVLPTFNQMVTEVHTVDQAIYNMRERSEQVKDNCAGITSALEELQQTQQVLGVSISEVSAVSQQSSASTEEVASLCNQQALIGSQLVQLSSSLAELSLQLEQQMIRIKLD